MSEAEMVLFPIYPIFLDPKLFNSVIINNSCISYLLQISNQREVLISIIEVLASHTPNESIVVCGGCAMD